MSTSARVNDGVSSERPAADWSTSYSQFLSRATAHAAKTLSLYQRALENVSTGKLEPTVFQTHFPTFTQAYGPEYASGLSELGARFMSRLVETIHQYLKVGGESGAAVLDPELIPPRFEAADPVRWFEQFAEYAGKLNSRALKAYRAQLDQVAAGESTPGDVQRKTSDYLTRQLPGYLQEISQLYFDLLNGINEIRGKYEEAYFNGILALTHQPEREPPVLLHLTAPRGEKAYASLSISNTTREKTAVHCTFTDARRLNGEGPAFSPEIAISPDIPELLPGEEKKVLLSVHLAEDRYEEGVPYTCTVYITGNAALRVELQLRIVATAATHAATHTNSAGE